MANSKFLQLMLKKFDVNKKIKKTDCIYYFKKVFKLFIHTMIKKHIKKYHNYDILIS